MTAPIQPTDEDVDLTDEPTGEPSGDENKGEDATATDAKETLGDAGKKALDAMKEKWRSERDARKAAEDKLAAATKPKPAEGEPLDLDALRKQARDEAKAEVLRERALDKIEAKAAGRFRDVEDALLRLGRNVDEFIDGDKIDVSAIEDALVELLDKRPDFGVTQSEPKRFKGTADGGAKGMAGKPQLTEADVDRMSAARDYAGIAKARAEGRLNNLLGIKT